MQKHILVINHANCSNYILKKYTLPKSEKYNFYIIFQNKRTYSFRGKEYVAALVIHKQTKRNQCYLICIFIKKQAFLPRGFVGSQQAVSSTLDRSHIVERAGRGLPSTAALELTVGCGRICQILLCMYYKLICCGLQLRFTLIYYSVVDFVFIMLFFRWMFRYLNRDWKYIHVTSGLDIKFLC